MPSTARSKPTSEEPGLSRGNASRSGLRTRVFYVSYDGLEEPLGRSQVLSYLERLSVSFDLTLVSFEKSFPPPEWLRAEMQRLGIEWVPLRYHRQPPVLSTVIDVLAARRALIRAARAGLPDIVHVRSYVPALMALSARAATRGKLLFDIRGFWADERVEGGLWRARGWLYRLAKRCERRFFAEADAIVTLTHASVAQIESYLCGRDIEIEVIPTCVDPHRFSTRPARQGPAHAVWSGSLGTWYRFDLAARVAAALDSPLTVVTRQTALAKQLLNGYPAQIRSATPDEVPNLMFAGDVGLCLIVSSFSKVASAPTRFAEYLAAGMPVVVTPGVGDLETIVEDRGVGVVLRGEDQGSVSDAVRRLRLVMAEPDLAQRCRGVAAELFDVDAGSRQYAALYERLAEADG